MPVLIRDLQADDYAVLVDWWTKAGELAPPGRFLPIGSSFIAEIDGKPALAVTLYLPNGPVAWIDHFIGNPEMAGKARRRATKKLLTHLENLARDLGYERVFCMATNDRLKSYYQELGFSLTASNIFTFIKEL